MNFNDGLPQYGLWDRTAMCNGDEEIGGEGGGGGRGGGNFFNSGGDGMSSMIPRSPRPPPPQVPVLFQGLDDIDDDNLLLSAEEAAVAVTVAGATTTTTTRPRPVDIPPPAAPEGAAAVRHYQVGFGHTIIPKRSSISQSVHTTPIAVDNNNNNNNNDDDNTPTITTTGSSAGHKRQSKSMSSIIDNFDSSLSHERKINNKDIENKNNENRYNSNSNNNNNNNKNNNSNNNKEKKMKIGVEKDERAQLEDMSELFAFLMKQSESDHILQEELLNKVQNFPKNEAELLSNIESILQSDEIAPIVRAIESSEQSNDGLNVGDTGNRATQIDCILKIGGAFLTDKSSLHTLREKHIRQACEDIAKVYRENNRFQLIIIHGAGSFGHFEAKQYQLFHGLATLNSTGRRRYNHSRQGFAKTRRIVTQLHQHIMNTLVQELDLPAVSVSPCGLVNSCDGMITRKGFKTFSQHIRKILQNGMIPVTHGDVVFDDTRGCSILSGDTILEHLTAILTPQRAVFWTDVDGLYEQKNNNGGGEEEEEEWELTKQVYVDAKGRPQLPPHVLQQLKTGELKSPTINQINVDVKKQEQDKDEKEKEKEKEKPKKEKKVLVNKDGTGGMYSKVQVASRCCALGCDVTITQGGTPDALRALSGRFVENGTIFIPEHH